MTVFSIFLVFAPDTVMGQVSRFQSAAPAATAANEERAIILLNDSLKDKNPETRTHAVQSLGLVGSREPWISNLVPMLDDKDVQVRLAAIASLLDLKNEGTVAILRQALQSDVAEVSFAAAKALWTLNDPVGRDALVSILAGDTKAKSGFLTLQRRDALRMLHTPHTMFLFALNQGVNFAPVPGLGLGVSSLNGILSDPATSGRAAAALLLGTDNDPDVRQALQDALTDKDWAVRAAAVHSIAMRDDPALQPELLPLLDDRKEAVRVRAAAGFLRLGWIGSAR